jgi:hypothetical protein
MSAIWLVLAGAAGAVIGAVGLAAWLWWFFARNIRL